MLKNENIYIVVPVYNEAPVIEETIREIKSAGYKNIIVVDDGSLDETYQKITKLDVISLRLPINRGKGAAIKTGIEAAKILGVDIVVTMDGDGQHNPLDIEKMLTVMRKDAIDVILGTRLKNPKGMPCYKIWANRLGNFFTWLFYGLWVSDSQSGFRVYSQKAINLINTQTDRYEYDSEVIREIGRHKLTFREVPIEVRYTNYSMNKINRQGLKNGLKTLIKMLISI